MDIVKDLQQIITEGEPTHIGRVVTIDRIRSYLLDYKYDDSVRIKNCEDCKYFHNVCCIPDNMTCNYSYSMSLAEETGYNQGITDMVNELEKIFSSTPDMKYFKYIGDKLKK